MNSPYMERGGGIKSLWIQLVAVFVLFGCAASDEKSFRGGTDKSTDSSANGPQESTPQAQTKEDPTPQEEEAAPVEEDAVVEEPVAPPADPNVVEFRIAAGTGQNAWNTLATVVNVKIGQTLKIFNDDNIVHRMHTDDAPCPHGEDIPPGAMMECPVALAIDPGVGEPDTYDHNTSGAFFLKAVP